MHQWSLKLLASIILSVTALTAYAVDSITVATDEWEGYSNKNGTGYYTDLIKAIYEPNHVKVTVQYVPYARSVDMVINKQADVVLGTYGDDLPGGAFSQPVEMDSVDAAVTPALASTWKDINSLEGKNVVAKVGYAFDTAIKVKMHYSENANLGAMLQMLDAGRADAILDYEPDLLEANKALSKPVNMVIKKGVFGKPILFGFSGTPQGKELRDMFDAGLKKLRENGQLKALMEKNGLDASKLIN